VSQLSALLTQHVGQLPPDWDNLLKEDRGGVRVLQRAVVLSDDPAVLDKAARSRSVRRYLLARLGPGIALTDDVERLARVLADRAIAVDVETPLPPAPPTAFSQSEYALLFAACASLRQQSHAPTAALDQLQSRLLAALPAKLRDQLTFQPPTAAEHAAETMPQQPSPDLTRSLDKVGRGELVGDLRDVIRRRLVLQICYTDGAGVTTERTVRPLRLEQHGEQWYLEAYCTASRSERTFRIDRINSYRSYGRRPDKRKAPATIQPLAAPAPAVATEEREQRSGCTTAPSSREAPRVWLEE